MLTGGGWLEPDVVVLVFESKRDEGRSNLEGARSPRDRRKQALI